MPRKSRPRLGLYYFVLRGPEGRDIFLSNSEYPAFIDVLASLAQETCYRVYALCLLPGRVHLAVRMSSVPLHDFIQRLMLKFAQRMKLKRGCGASLFALPYKLTLIDREEKVRALIRFIHLLPSKLGQDPAEYAWSGHRSYLGKARLPGIDVRAGLRLFDGENRQARSRYASYVLRGLHPENIADFARRLTGDASASGYDDILRLSLEGHGDVRTISSLEQLAVAVSRMGERPFEDVRSNSRERICSVLRAVIAWHARRLEIASFAEVAGYLRRDPSTLYAAIKHYRALQPMLFDEPGHLGSVKQILAENAKRPRRKRKT